PQCDSLAVRKTAALAPANEAWTVVDVAEELRAEAALADARLAHDRHEPAAGFRDRALERIDEERLLNRSPDERRQVHAGHLRAEPRSRGERSEGGER